MKTREIAECVIADKEAVTADEILCTKNLRQLAKDYLKAMKVHLSVRNDFEYLQKMGLNIKLSPQVENLLTRQGWLSSTPQDREREDGR